MARATSGTTSLSFSGLGFWISMLLLIFLPESAIKMIAALMKKDQPDDDHP